MPPNLNRRSFLASLAAAAVLDPERLLWVPGKKLISIPPAPKLIASLDDFGVGDIITLGGFPGRYVVTAVDRGCYRMIRSISFEPISGPSP